MGEDFRSYPHKLFPLIGVSMTHRSHLPIAVTYPDDNALVAMSLERLTTMLRECNRWFANMAAFRSALQTEAGRTEWKVLTRKDIEDATAAKIRLQTAIDRHHDIMLDGLVAERPTKT